MAQTEVERLTRSVCTLTEALEEKDKLWDRIAPDVETLLWFCDKHFENVRSNEKVATEKELTGLRAHTRLREIFKREDKPCQE